MLNSRKIFLIALALLYLSDLSAQIIEKSNPQIIDPDHINNSLFNHKYYLKIKFYTIPSEIIQSDLKKEGISLLAYVSDKTYVASIEENALETVASMAHIQSLIPIDINQRVHNSVKTYFSESNDSASTIDVGILYFEDIDRQALSEELRNKNYQVLVFTPNLHNVLIRVPLNRISELASQPWLYWLELLPPPFVPSNLSARNNHRSNLLDHNTDSSQNYTGEGVKVGMWDVGPVGYHIDLIDRIIIREDSLPESGHSTFVAGILAGSGLLNANLKGMACGTTLYSWDFWGWVPYEMDTAVNKDSIVITQHSYNYNPNWDTCWKRGHYDLYSYLNDLLLVKYPYLSSVYAAGNYQSHCSDKGFRTVSSGPQAAKNIIDVGAVTSKDGMSSLSSWGPLRDGRIKPDIVGVGVSVTSTAINDNYTTATGTSASCPGISGVLAQLYQLYREQFNKEPDAGILKAIICNTAYDLGNPGPDFKYGFGRIDAGKAAQVIRDQRFMFDSISHHQKKIMDSIEVKSDIKQLKILLYWTDTPASPYSPVDSCSLVNHLDLLVFDEQLNRYYPLILDPMKPDNVAFNELDTINNIEQVVLNNPKAGKYYIAVEGYFIPSGKQSYTITYEAQKNEIEITYPNGNEHLVPGATETIRWNAFGNTGDYLIEFSSDSGLNWGTVSASVAANVNCFDWKVPQIISGNCLIRISSGNMLSDISDTFFFVMTKLQSINYKSNGGHFVLYWSRLAEAGSYQIFIVENGKWKSLANTTDSFFYICGLQMNKKYYFGISAKSDSGVVGQISNALVLLCDSSFVLPKILSSSPPDTFCIGSDAQFWYHILENFPVLKAWEFSADSGKTWNEIQNAHDTILIIDDLLENQNASMYRIKLFDTCLNLMVYGDPIQVYIYPQLKVKILSPDDSLCFGEPVVLETQVSGGIGSNTRYSWSHSSDSTSATTYIPEQNQTITVGVTDLCNSDPVKDSLMIYIRETNSDWIYSINSFDITVEALNKDAKLYHWDFGNGDTSNLLQTTNHYTTEDSFKVCLTVTDYFNCLSTTCKLLVLTDIFKDKNDKISIIPCPNTGQFRLMLPQLLSSQFEIRIFNMQGKVLFSNNFGNYPQNFIDFKFEDMQSGLYLISYISNEDIITSMFVIK